MAREDLFIYILTEPQANKQMINYNQIIQKKHRRKRRFGSANQGSITKLQPH